MPNGLPISISGTAPSYGPNLAIMAATERQAMKHGAALAWQAKKVQILLSVLQKRRDAYIQKETY